MGTLSIYLIYVSAFWPFGISLTAVIRWTLMDCSSTIPKWCEWKPPDAPHTHPLTPSLEVVILTTDSGFSVGRALLVPSLQLSKWEGQTKRITFPPLEWPRTGGQTWPFG